LLWYIRTTAPTGPKIQPIVTRVKIIVIFCIHLSSSMHRSIMDLTYKLSPIFKLRHPKLRVEHLKAPDFAVSNPGDCILVLFALSLECEKLFEEFCIWLD